MEEIGLKELFDYFIAKIEILFLILTCVLVIGNVYSLFIKTPLYKSEVKLVLVSENNTQAGITQGDVQLNNNLVDTYTEIIKSKDLLSKVITNLHLENETIESLSNKISVLTTINTQTITIVVSDEDPETAKLIVDELTKVFSTEITNIYKLDNVHIYESSSKAKEAYNVNLLKENVLYVGIGLFTGFIIVLLMFSFDTTIKTSEDVEEKLGLTVLGVIPKVGDGK